MAFRLDPYMSKQLQVAYRRGVVDYFVGIYKILVGIVGLLGVMLVWMARRAIYYLHSNQRSAPQKNISRPSK